MAAEPRNVNLDERTDLEAVLRLAETGSPEQLRSAVAPLHPADVADLLNATDNPDTRLAIFSALEPAAAAEVARLSAPPLRQELVATLSDDQVQSILEELDSDEAADLIAALPQDRAQLVLTRLPGPISARIQQLLRYPPDTAGGRMQAEYAAVLEGATVEEAIDIVRTIAQDVPNIPNLFVVDHQFHLLGLLPLAKLILAREGQKVDAIMDRDVVAVTVDTDQEEVTRLFKKYNLLSLPVTDGRGALLGRITIDDVVDVLEEEANEDFSKLAGLGQEEPIFDTPLRAIRRRLPWLALNLLTTSLGAFVIGRFESTIQTVAIAAALMTIVAAQGGNAGVQTLTVIVRGLALGKVTALHARRLVLKELGVGMGNGLVLGVLAASSAYLWHGQALLAGVLGLALCVNFVVAALAGSLIPLTLRWAGADPAVGSSVLLTACTDMCGFFSFLGILTAGLTYLA